MSLLMQNVTHWFQIHQHFRLKTIWLRVSQRFHFEQREKLIWITFWSTFVRVAVNSQLLEVWMKVFSSWLESSLISSYDVKGQLCVQLSENRQTDFLHFVSINLLTLGWFFDPQVLRLKRTCWNFELILVHSQHHRESLERKNWSSHAAEIHPMMKISSDDFFLLLFEFRFDTNPQWSLSTSLH